MKKAQLGFLQKLILILAGSFVLLLVFGMTFAKYMGEASELERCKTSAMIMDAAREKTTEKILNLDCQMRETYVDYKDVRVDGKLSEDSIYRVIAEDMKDAWYVMGEGRFLPFDQKMLLGITQPCVVFSHITFDEKIGEEKKEISGFDQYIKTTDAEGKDIKYFEYFALDKSVKDTMFLNRNYGFLIVPGSNSDSFDTTDKLDLTKEYYVMYKVDLEAATDTASNHWVEKAFPEALKEFFSMYGVSGRKIIFYVVAADNLGGTGCGYIANSVR